MVMDTVSKKDGVNGCVKKPLAVAVAVASLEMDRKQDEDRVNGKNDSDSNSLSTLPRKGGMSRKLNKSKTSRRVQWNDMIGNKLVEVLEYEPSDDSDSEDDDSCLCSLM
ncbi:uncharacterized protein LOC131625762 [Vicia villosa]|uniref:uncharacterized protein LOC131625762 n=1 Tax=Vicia villosa TaxID=3911 RepID=UPI00273C86E2|nr:uncharacterized protein LOC131625762 [Vicia villosa]